MTHILLMSSEKRISTKNPTYRTGDIHMYEPVLLAAGNLHLSQLVPFWAELSQASSCRPLCQVIDMQRQVCRKAHAVDTYRRHPN